jgi:ATP-dependent DNA ligase
MEAFPPLVSHTAGGKTMLWQIRVEPTKDGHGLIIVERGHEGGKVTRDEKVIEEGKNLGKKNETTPLQQAILEARSAWNKKKSAGYEEAVAKGGAGAPSMAATASVAASKKPSKSLGVAAAIASLVGSPAAASIVASASASVAAPVAPSVSKAAGKAAMNAAEAIAPSRAAVITMTAPLPMLAERFQDRGSKIVFPCFVQPKFDGTRTIGICGLKAGEPCLFSRTRKAYPHLEHIQAVIRSLPKGLVLDGELYTNEYNFQEIVGTVKKKTLTAADAVKHGHIQLHVYDIVMEGMGFEDRFKTLVQVFDRFKDRIGTVLQLCKTEVAANEAAVKKKHDEYVEEGYEGIMLRNKDGLYKVGGRSVDLQKFKMFLDDEYDIVGFYEGEGAEKGCVLWRCKTPEGRVFGCRPHGTQEERRELFKHGSEYVGKKLTVRYQELTDDGIPRFPVGIAIRDYE